MEKDAMIMNDQEQKSTQIEIARGQYKHPNGWGTELVIYVRSAFGCPDIIVEHDEPPHDKYKEFEQFAPGGTPCSGLFGDAVIEALQNAGLIRQCNGWSIERAESGMQSQTRSVYESLKDYRGISYNRDLTLSAGGVCESPYRCMHGSAAVGLLYAALHSMSYQQYKELLYSAGRDVITNILVESLAAHRGCSYELSKKLSSVIDELPEETLERMEVFEGEFGYYRNPSEHYGALVKRYLQSDDDVTLDDLRDWLFRVRGCHGLDLDDLLDRPPIMLRMMTEDEFNEAAKENPFMERYREMVTGKKSK